MNKTKTIARRSFFGTATAAAATALTADSVNAATEQAFTPLGPDDRVRLSDEPKALVEKAARKAAEYYDEYGSCARCTASGIMDSLDFVPSDDAVHRAAACLDGGATPKGEANCGAFTASGMIIGHLTGENDFGSTRFAHTLMRKLYDKYDGTYGSVLCRDIRKYNKGKCKITVARAAKWVSEILIEQFGEK